MVKRGSPAMPKTGSSETDLQERTRRATRQLLRWLPWAVLNLVVVGAGIVVGSIALSGTAVTLVVLSPILIPAGFLLLLTVGSVLAVVAVSVAVISACYGLYSQIKNASANQRPAATQDVSNYRKQVLAAAGA